jgi:hypothetical protein
MILNANDCTFVSGLSSAAWHEDIGRNGDVALYSPLHMTNVNSQLHQPSSHTPFRNIFMVKENITEQFTTSQKEGIL